MKGTREGQADQLQHLCEGIQVDILPYVVDSVCGVELGHKPSAICQTNLN